MRSRLLGLGASLTLLASLSCFEAAQARTSALPPPSSTLTLAEAKQRFRRAVAFSFMPGRSGQLFLLPRRHASVMFESGDYSLDGASHVGGKRLKNDGATHGSVWEYDTEIPLVFYGPGLVKSGLQLSEPVTQQDIVPTYARLIGAIPPRDALHGRALTAPFLADRPAPKAILTLVFDQGGWQYYRAHPQAWPHMKRLMEQGTVYTQGRIAHLDAETAVGHIAIGTGAYPYQHGIISNSFYLGPLGQRSSLLGPERSPVFINSPSLADVWDRQQQNKPLILSYAYADRASIGMGGHGSLFSGGDKDLVLYYDRQTGGVTTNTRYYQLPDYLADLRVQPYLERLLGARGTWFGHQVNDLVTVNNTPAQAEFDTEVFLRLLEREAVGQDDTADLLYLTLKSSDACGHAFGAESDECRSVLQTQDTQAQRVIDAFLRKVGPGKGLVVLTADHGGAPLNPLSGGVSIKAEALRADLNQRFDNHNNGVELAYDMLASQIYIDEAERVRNQVSWESLREWLQNYQVGGKPAFEEVLTRREVAELQLEYGLMD
ncbi:MAG: alkaline phosphatase family protein [Candidatus Sericytochromatia bacterium]